MRPIVRLLPFFSLLLSSHAAAALSPVEVQVSPGAAEIDAAPLREAVARELGAPVLDGTEAVRAPLVLVVGVDRARSELVVERRDAFGGMSRRVPLPADRAEALRVAVFLIGNLARDEAEGVLRELRPPPRAEPAAPPATRRARRAPPRALGAAALVRRRRRVRPRPPPEREPGVRALAERRRSGQRRRLLLH